MSVKASAFGRAWAKKKYGNEFKQVFVDGVVVKAIECQVKKSKLVHKLVVEYNQKEFRLSSAHVKTFQEVSQNAQFPQVENEDIEEGEKVDVGDEGIEVSEPVELLREVEWKDWTSTISIDYRDGPKSRPRLHIPNIETNSPTPFSLFLSFFPFIYFRDTVLPAWDKNGFETQTQWTSISVGEALLWLGYIFSMGFFIVSDRADYWSKAGNQLFPPLDFGRMGISRRRFDALTSAFLLTSAFHSVDMFFPVRNWLQSWNENMKQIFTPGWTSCLDESMSVWANRKTCPGWMYVSRKPHPQGNEYHTLADSETKIIYQFELVEGGDRSPSLGEQRYSNLGKTTALLLRMTEDGGLWGSGKCIFMDSAFAVLDGIVALRKHGVFAFAIVKKRRYWPKNIPGEELLEKTISLPLGGTVARVGKLDGENIVICGLRDNCFAILAVSSFGTLLPGSEVLYRKTDHGVVSFKRPVLYEQFYFARHAVDDNNNLRQGWRGIEEIWETKIWLQRVFSFTVGLTEVNAYLAHRHFVCPNSSISLQQFRRSLARDLINNPFLISEQQIPQTPTTRAKTSFSHVIQSIPQYSSWDGKSWKKKLKSQFPQRQCLACRRYTSFYCICSPARSICKKCFGPHVSSSVP